MAIARLAAPPLASAMAIIQPDRKPINQLARQQFRVPELTSPATTDYAVLSIIRVMRSA
jgi:hypothetical protein